MDTLTILEKLKKKIPNLKEDPLMLELEMGLSEANPASEGGGPAGGLLPGKMKPDSMKTSSSYLDEEDMLMGGPDVPVEEAPGEEGADALMGELEAEASDAELPPEEAMSEGAAPMSYLDEEEEEDMFAAEPVAVKAKMKRRIPK